MIDIGRFEPCVCKSNGIPDKMCSSDLAFEEKGKKVRLSLRAGEEAKAVVIDQCVCKDEDTKCDGLFIYRRTNKNWMLLVELKGIDFSRAFEQLAYTKNKRPAYKEIETLFMANQTGKVQHHAFIVSNAIISPAQKQKLENANGIRVKTILNSEATSPIPDLRKYL